MGRKKYALVWWINSCYKDVLELSTFPAKSRFVNGISTLIWMDHKTGLKTKGQAKILAISEDKTALEHIFVSDEGEILDHSRRVFSKEVIEEKKNFDQKNKFKKKIIKSNKRKFENALLNETSIVPNYQANKTKIEQSSMQLRDIPEYEGDFLQSTNSNPKETSTHPGCSTSQIDTIKEQQVNPGCSTSQIDTKREQQVSPGCSTSQIHPMREQQVNQVHGTVSPPAAISKRVRSSFEDNTSPYGKFLTSEHDRENNISSSSEDEDVNKENWNGSVKAMAATFPGKITKEVIAFHELLLASMKYAYKSAHQSENCSTTFELPPHHLRAAANMQEISPKCGFYLSTNVITYINTMVETDLNVEQKNKWKIIVREVLLEIYGHTIANYVAKGKGGKKGGKPSINPLLLKGLFQWASQVSCNLLYKDFIYYINKFAANKRRYQQSKAAEARQQSSGKKVFLKDVQMVTDDESEATSSVTNERKVYEKAIENVAITNNREIERGCTSTGILEPSRFAHSEMGPRNLSAISPPCPPHIQAGSSSGFWVPQQETSYVPTKLQNSERIDWAQCLQQL